MNVFGTQIKKTTLALIGLLLAGSVASQTAWVQANVIPVLSAHPKLAPLGTLLLGIVALLHNPVALQLLQSLNIKQTQMGGGVTTVTTGTVETTATKTLPLLLVLVLAGSLTGCNTWERDTFNTLAASNAVINQAEADYNAKTIAQSRCAYALINDGKAAQTIAVSAMIVYEQEKSAGVSLTAQTATVTADLAALPALVAQIKALYTNPAGCVAPAFYVVPPKGSYI
jgi:hypothetical protein